jgi:hypothetical protein
MTACAAKVLNVVRKSDEKILKVLNIPFLGRRLELVHFWPANTRRGDSWQGHEWQGREYW